MTVVTDPKLTEEEAFLEEVGDGKSDEAQSATMLLSFRDGISGLARVLKAIEVSLVTGGHVRMFTCVVVRG